MLDHFTDGEGLRAIDDDCEHVRARYTSFHTSVLQQLLEYKDTQAEKWSLFLECLRCADRSTFEYYRLAELNEVGI